MNCASCGHDNPDSARFCLECGTPFALRCAGCGAELPGGAKFCLECGAAVVGAASERAALAPARSSPRAPTSRHLADKIRPTKSALEGERKQVTVLFADVKGSMELAEQLDPEEWSQIMQRFFAILAEGVQRFEGSVDKFTGDGIMALFGAPIAHEDHAQRACWAALHLRDVLSRYVTEVKRTHGLSFSTRMGLHSGEVVVGRIGDDLRMDYTAQGHTWGLRNGWRRWPRPTPATSATRRRRSSAATSTSKIWASSRSRASARPVRVHRLAGVGAARDPLRRVAEPRPHALRRPRRGHGDARGGAGAGANRPRAGGRRGGGGGHGEEPTLLRVRRALPGPRHDRERGTRPGARAEHSLPADAAGVPRLLRNHRAGRRPHRAREDRGAHAAPRRGIPRGAARAVRVLRRARPGATRAPDGSRGQAAPALRRAAPARAGRRHRGGPRASRRSSRISTGSMPAARSSSSSGSTRSPARRTSCC